MSNRADPQAQDGNPSQRVRWQVLAACGLLLAAIGIVFGQAVTFEFVNFDDNVCVYENPAVTGGLSAEHVGWAFAHRYAGVWAPLVWTSHMLDWTLYGREAGGHHLTNVLLHAATTLLLFFALRRMTGRIWPSALAAALFAVHPLRVESVAWVTERKDVLSGLFFVLTLWAYAGYARRGRKTPQLVAGAFHARCDYASVMILFAFALMSKPVVVTLPFVLLVLDYWPLGRMTSEGSNTFSACSSRKLDAGGRGRRSKSGGTAARSAASPKPDRPIVRLVVEKLPLFALAAIFCVVTVWAQGETLQVNNRYGLGWRLCHVPVAYVGYLVQLVCPVNLAVPYPRPGHLIWWQVVGSLLLLAILTAGAVASRRRFPYLLVGWLWYLGMLLPAVGLVQFGVQATADRFTYLPQIGLCIALAWGAADLFGQPGPWTVYAAMRRFAVSVTAIVAVAILLVCAHHQTSIWRDNETLWRHTLDCTENNIIAHINLGNALSDQKEYAKATDEYRAALAIDPSSSEALNNLGRLLFAQGRDGPTSARQASWEEGLRYFGQAVQMRPEQAERHYRFADALASTGRLDAAVAEYGEAIRIDPDLADAENGLGKTLSDLGRPEQAIAHYRAALRIAPEHAEAHYNLAIALSQCRRFTEAIAESREAIRLKPDDAEAHNNLGLALAGAGRLSEAMTEYREAARINPDCIQALGNLAAAYVGVGRRSDAIETLRTALKRATEQRDREMISVLRARLSQYEAASPSR